MSHLPGDKDVIRRHTTQSTNHRSTQQLYPTDKNLYKSCLKYLSQRDDGVNSVQQFMAQFDLDLGSIGADWKGDLMYTMTQLSFDYGVHSLLAMDGTFSLVADPARPFIMRMEISSSASEFFARWQKVSEENWKPYYKACLEAYGLNVKDNEVEQLVADLIAQDMKIADAYQDVLSQVQQDWELVSIDVIAGKIHVSPDLWLAATQQYGRTDYDLRDGVNTTVAIMNVASAALSSQDMRMTSRKVVAWHLLRSLMGQKVSCSAAFKTALDTGGEQPALGKPEDVCRDLLAFTKTIRGEAIDLLEGANAMPIARILDITRMMARLQQTAAAITRGLVGLRLISADGSEVASMTFPKSASAHSSKAPRFFAGVDTIPQDGFVSDWLRRLRAWQVLPPLFRAYLEVLAGTIKDTKAAGNLFEPPYYYDDGLTAYNYGVLGQLISREIAKYLKNKVTESEKEAWREFWNHNDALDYKSVYCLLYSNKTHTGPPGKHTEQDENSHSRRSAMSHDRNSSTTEKPKKHITHHRIDETLFDEKKASHIRASRIAYLTFQGLPSAQRQVLPSLRLSPSQLFLIAHCAFSCTQDSRDNANRHGGTDASCMVIFVHSRGLARIPCGKGQDQAFESCTYA
ncbi:uncharacterized protein LOC142786412 [Rhipicephalus microplus]|uniref:uncharacterized protein LOC142786412 n=1 Tax=Rhipicephalus microplus TaxID=6941 RepID=UPI003F6C0218